MRSLLVVALAVGSLSLGGCWLVAAGAGAEAGYVAAQEDRTVSETLTDQRITAAVKSALIADDLVPGFRINVDTFRGNVTLRGYVNDPRAIDRAMAIASSIDGVRDVDNRLVLDRG